ncbi:hypothetical protein TpMuguga_01g00172 [Theileria parva strain Muguga]|uniref:uncharacterized protein n=1 Tax=Theileria parva strain Muguga TaxID=333668 RepID=UPI001C622048|nr:uncharacterized protein TpMuguga_01g00172 [Theileria parva strain Muguga]EAN33416.2 hypothetical protein TpMuguga_01g00172 [Theileria parva strain Muguga]
MCKLLCYFLLFVYFAESHTNNGLNIDINYNNDSNIENTTNSIKSDILVNKLPVPYLYIKPNELENVHQIAESALENESIIADTEDVYERIISEIEERSPEEMIMDIIGKINKLEALKAQLGTEERIARLKLSGKNATYANSIPVSHPIAVNPTTT